MADGHDGRVTNRVPGAGKYAQLEREQRWTVHKIPARAHPLAEILDRYILGSRLRLRRVDAGDDVVLKLTQKVRTVEADPEIVKLTNMYLSSAEYAVVAALPAIELRKSRWQVSWNGSRLAIDELHDRLHGLMLAEVELDQTEPRRSMPPFAVRDVTNDDRFSGGALATASEGEIHDRLHEITAAGRD